jgi:uncharacterized membrane protein HdeD (DUF308 family)
MSLSIITLIVRYGYVFFLLGTGVMTLIAWNKGVDMSAGVSAKTAQFMKAIMEAKYIIPFMGIFKIIAGILLAFNPTAKLAILMCLPYVINILLYVIFIANKDYLLLGIIDSLLCFYLVFAYSEYFKPILK